MPPKVKFTKEDIIQAGFELVGQDSLESLTARNIAKKMSSSTAPVYSHFKSLAGLEQKVITRARDLLLDYASRHYTDRVFLNMGVGIAIFAREHPKLYHALFLEKKDFEDIVNEFLECMNDQMKNDERFNNLSEASRKRLLYKMWVFTHGLASLICVGLIKVNSDKFIIGFLQEVGFAIITNTFTQENKQN